MFLNPSPRSIKHYFLLDSGDFFGTFMDLAENELQKQVSGEKHTHAHTMMQY